MSYKKGYIADTIHGNVELTSFERKVMSHVTFNRLHDVYQNSTVYLTFPSNRTKRFEHSIGTMKICNDMFCMAVKNSETDVRNEFFSLFEKSLIDMLKSIKDVKYNQYEKKIGGRIKKIVIESVPESLDKSLSSLAYSYYNEKDNTFIVILQAVRLAALLHDVGHPPYSHITEYALMDIKKLYEDSVSTDRIKEFNEITQLFLNGNGKKLHEQMGDEIVDIILSDSIKEINHDTANENPEVLKDQTFQILVKETVSNILNNVKPFDILHRIIDGTLDGDRLDYVTRDVLNSGLKKGKIEYDRLCSSMVLCKINNDFWFCPNIKALNTVEDYLNRRWDLYKSIIFHHRVIKTDYLLQNIIKQISIKYLEQTIEGEKQKEYSDLLPSDISGLWKALKKSTNIERSYAISQWDDSWLTTVLKKHYFNDFIGKKDILSCQLSEFLTNRKYYFSVIKRLEDFLVIDNAIAERVNCYSDEIKSKITCLRDLSSKFSKMQKEEENEVKTITIDPFLEDIEKTLILSGKVGKENIFQGLIFSHIKNLYIKDDVENFLVEIFEQSKNILSENFVKDIMFVVKKYDIGLKKPLYLYNSYTKKYVSIHDVSSISKILQLNYDTFPQFFIYILKNEKYKEENIDVNAFLKNIGLGIADKFRDEIVLSKLDKSIDQYKDLMGE